jgi:hypothetical protein
MVQFLGFCVNALVSALVSVMSSSCPVSASIPDDLIQFLSWYFVMNLFSSCYGLLSWYFVMILFSSCYGLVMVLCKDLLFSSYPNQMLMLLCSQV